MSKKYNASELRQLSQSARQNQSDIYAKACKVAYDEIISKADEKIQEAIEKGNFRAYLYTWFFVEDKNDRKYTFNNVRILDIVTKTDLIDDLRAYFSTASSDDDDANTLYVDWHKFKSDGKEPSKYGIYVSWAEHKDKDNNDEKIDETTTKQDQTSKEFVPPKREKAAVANNATTTKATPVKTVNKTTTSVKKATK